MILEESGMNGVPRLCVESIPLVSVTYTIQMEEVVLCGFKHIRLGEELICKTGVLMASTIGDDRCCELQTATLTNDIHVPC